MEPTPFLFEDKDSSKPLIPLHGEKRVFDEAWLQEFLRQHPEILPAANIEFAFSPLIPIGREVATKSGPIDNLFISKLGYPVLVETKLWRNPEAKREVLAQVIDYGNCLAQWTFAQLDEATREYTRKYEKSEVGLIDWIEQRSGPAENGRVSLENTITTNLRFGRFLILIVGDRIRSSMVEILQYANRFPHLAVNVALVELRCYQLQEENSWPLLVVPQLVAKTETVGRSIVEVTVSIDGTSQVRVKQEGEAAGRKTGRRITLTEQLYWDTLKNKAPGSFSPAEEIIERFRNLEMIEVEPKENSIAVYLVLPDSGQRITLFFIRTDGIIDCWHISIADQLARCGLDRVMADDYARKLFQVLKSRTRKLSIYGSARDINREEFYTVVDAFIDQVKNAEPEN